MVEYFQGIETCLKKTLGDSNWGPIFGFKRINTTIYMIGGEKILNINGNDIKISFSTKDVASPIELGKKLITAYALDGNAFVGNEYWKGMTAASGDPAAVCCSMIGYTQNPLINPYLDENVRGLIDYLMKQGKLGNLIQSERKKALEQKKQDLERLKQNLDKQAQDNKVRSDELEENKSLLLNEKNNNPINLQTLEQEISELKNQKNAGEKQVVICKAKETEITQKLETGKAELQAIDKKIGELEKSWHNKLPFFMNTKLRAFGSFTLAASLAALVYCLLNRDNVSDTIAQLYNAILLSRPKLS